MIESDFDLVFQNQSTDSKIVASLERISQAFRVLLWQQSKEYSLSPIQVQILIFLRHHSEEKRKVSYLADEFNMTKATISDTVKTLGQKELVSKIVESHDTRSYILHLTEKGKEVADKTSLFANEIRTPVSDLETKDKEKMLLGLLNIIKHLNQTGVITIQRMCMTCIHYLPQQNGEKDFCKLLNLSLNTSDLRVDCSEHKPFTSGNKL